MLGSQYNIDNTDQPTSNSWYPHGWYSRESRLCWLHTLYGAFNQEGTNITHNTFRPCDIRFYREILGHGTVAIVTSPTTFLPPFPIWR